MIISYGNATKYRPTSQERLLMTVKAWGKYNRFMQENLTMNYEIILTDHQTKGEKVRGFLSKFTFENLDKGLDKFDKGMIEFDKMLKDNKGFKIYPNDKHNYNVLLGKKTKTDYSFITRGVKKNVTI